MPNTYWCSFPLWEYAISSLYFIYLMLFDLVLYGIGIVELELESTSALVLLLFIIPLAFTLSGFLLWIMYSLNGVWQSLEKLSRSLSYILATITHLRARKQQYKLRMFQRLHLILLFAVLVVTAFFVVSSMSFSGRHAEGS